MSEVVTEQTLEVAQRPGSSARDRAVDALTELLHTGDEADRCYACRALGVIGSHSPIPSIVERLRDEDVDVCVDAAEALGRLGDADTVPALLASLQNDPEGDVKTAVVEALSRLGGAQATDALLRVAAGRPEDMSFDDTDSWDPWWDMQLTAVVALGELGEARAAPILDDILDDEEGQDIDAAVLKSLALLGEEGKRRLTRRFNDGGARTRRRVVTALAHADTPAALGMLENALRDEAPEVATAALEALDTAGAASYLPAILRLRQHPDSAVRATAARTAARLAARAAEDQLPVTELGSLLADPAPEVRGVALTALARITSAPSQFRADVEAAVLNAEGPAGMAACEVLAKFSDEAASGLLLETLADVRREPRIRCAAARMAGAMGRGGRETMERLTQAIGDAEQSVRLAALSALMDLGRGCSAEDQYHPEDVVLAALAGTLLPAEESPLSSEQPALTPSEAEQDGTLEGVATPTASDTGLRVEPAGEPPRSPTSTLEAIAMHNAEMALDSGERESLGTHDTALEEDAALREYMEIVNANTRTAEWLFARGIRSLNSDVRRLAARVLGGAGFTSALPGLVDALADDDDELRKEAAASVALIASNVHDPKALEPLMNPLLAACGDSARDSRAAAARALGVIGNRGCAATLGSLLNDPETAVRIQAVHALGGLESHASRESSSSSVGVAEPLELLLPMLEDDVPGVRKAALSSLAAMLEKQCVVPNSAACARALDKMFDAGFAGGGGQARDVARALKRVDPDAATDHGVARLSKLHTSVERRVAIEVLEELCVA